MIAGAHEYQKRWEFLRLQSQILLPLMIISSAATSINRQKKGKILVKANRCYYDYSIFFHSINMELHPMLYGLVLFVKSPVKQLFNNGAIIIWIL